MVDCIYFEDWESYALGSSVNDVPNWTSSSSFVKIQQKEGQKVAGVFDDLRSDYMEITVTDDGRFFYDWVAEGSGVEITVYVNGFLQSTHSGNTSTVSGTRLSVNATPSPQEFIIEETVGGTSYVDVSIGDTIRFSYSTGEGGYSGWLSGTRLSGYASDCTEKLTSGNPNNIKLIKWEGGLLTRGGGNVTADRDCCCCYCCYKFNGDEFPTGSGSDNGQIARLGDIYIFITGSTFRATGKCSVCWDLQLTVQELLTFQSCTTTGSLCLTYDCLYCPKPYWLFEMEDCAGDNILLQTPLSWIGGPDCLGAYADDPTCGDLNGFEEGGADINDPDGSVIIGNIGQCNDRGTFDCFQPPPPGEEI